MKTHQLTKKNNHRLNWPNFFLMLGTGILTLIVLFKGRGFPYELFHCELSPKKCGWIIQSARSDSFAGMNSTHEQKLIEYTLRSYPRFPRNWYYPKFRLATCHPVGVLTATIADQLSSSAL